MERFSTMSTTRDSTIFRALIIRAPNLRLRHRQTPCYKHRRNGLMPLLPVFVP